VRFAPPLPPCCGAACQAQGEGHKGNSAAKDCADCRKDEHRELMQTAEPDLVDEAIMLHISGAPLRLIALEMLSATWRIKSSIPQKRITAARVPRKTIPNRP